MIPFVVFDLDGTLIDGYAAIAEALSYALRRLNLPAPAIDEVRGMVGEGLDRLLEKAAGRDLAPQGVRLFRERYASVAIEGSRLMPRVGEVLEDLSRSEVPMAVASNKPARFSRMILDAKGIGRYFREIVGPEAEVPTKPDPTMLLGLMARAGAHPSATVVVGDMEIDSRFGRAAGCRVVLVPTGSRTREELTSVDSDALFHDLGDLPGWLDRELRLLQTHLPRGTDSR